MSSNYYDSLMSSNFRTEQFLREAEQNRLVRQAQHFSTTTETQSNQKPLFRLNWFWSQRANKVVEEQC